MKGLTRAEAAARRRLQWHVSLGYYVGPGPGGLVLVVGAAVVDAEVAALAALWRAYRWWPDGGEARALAWALDSPRYYRIVKRKRWRKGEARPDVFLTHPANVPHLATVLPHVAAQLAAPVALAEALPTAA